jgi:hypothetical protein
MKMVIVLTKEDLNKAVTDYLSNNDMCSPSEIKVDAAAKSVSAVFSPADISVEDILTDAFADYGLDNLDVESVQPTPEGVEIILVPKAK